MKAFVAEKYGSPDVLELRDIEAPVPGAHEVLVRVHAVGLNAADWRMLKADPFFIRLMFGLFKRKYPVLGADVAGRVEAVGSKVTQFKVGDEVFGDLAAHAWGGLAELACTHESLLAPKPTNLSFEEAAAVPMAGLTALQGLRDTCGVRAGQQVVINGASGGVGTFAVQLAKSYGAEVTAVCSEGNVELARALGADHVIDYRREDFTRSGQRYDVILAANGYHPLSAYRRALKPTGVYAMAGGTGKQMAAALMLGPLLSRRDGQRIGAVSAKANSADLHCLKDLLQAGSIKPVVDRRYPLQELPDAMRYLMQGHARGKIVITVRS